MLKVLVLLLVKEYILSTKTECSDKALILKLFLADIFTSYIFLFKYWFVT